MIQRALTEEQKYAAGLWNIFNGVALAGAFISMNGFEPPPKWILDSNRKDSHIILPTIDITEYGYEILEKARCFLDGWNHKLYISHAEFKDGTVKVRCQ